MKVFTVTILSVAIAALTVTLSANDKARELKLQQAIDLIESKGDLAKATPLLEDVAKSSDRALAARGLLHLAQAQERFGKGDALATYRRIVNDFAALKDVAVVSAAVAEARSKVGAGAQQGIGLVARQVLDSTGGVVSRDGTYLTFTDWTTGDLMVRDLSSGRNRRLTNNGQWNGNLAILGIPSNNGRRIAYGWYDETARRNEIRLVGRDGGRPAVVFTNKEPAGEVWPFAWTHDDKWILIAAGAESERSPCELLLVPVAGGAPRPVKRFDNCFAQHFSLSPDGRSVAYDRPARPGHPRRAVFWLSLDQGTEEPMLPDGANETMLGWFPGGGRILFASDRGGTNGIWATRVAGGRAAGEPVLIRREAGTVQGMGFTRRGDFYYQSRELENEIYEADLDPATGRHTAGVSRLKSRFVGLKVQAAWSPTGDRLAFIQAPVTTPTGPVRDQKLAIQTIATGGVRLLPLPLQNMQFPAWLPDGRALIVQGRDAGGRQGLHRVDLETGIVKTIAAREPANDIRRSLPAPARDGERLFYQWASATSAAGGIAVRDLASDVERRLTTQPVGSYALSPNGELLAMIEVGPDSGSDRRLTVIASSGAGSRVLSPTVGSMAFRGPLAWSADNRFVFVVRMGERDQEVWQVPVDGSAPRDTGIRWSGSIGRISAHPNGTRLALSTMGQSFKTWVLQNIPPQK